MKVQIRLMLTLFLVASIATGVFFFGHQVFDRDRSEPGASAEVLGFLAFLGEGNSSIPSSDVGCALIDWINRLPGNNVERWLQLNLTVWSSEAASDGSNIESTGTIDDGIGVTVYSRTFNRNILGSRELRVIVDRDQSQECGLSAFIFIHSL